MTGGLQSGDGWLTCWEGHRHWGRFGAAGLLLHRLRDESTGEVLLQHRAEWSHHGGTWGLLGGARHADESALAAALREAHEESGLEPALVAPHGRYEESHGGWSYVTMLAAAREGAAAKALSGESIEVRWVAVDQVLGLPLHPGLAGTWPVLRRSLHPMELVVDAANVVGSRPDGWWRDRAGAASRLLERCRAVASAGLSAAEIPPGTVEPALSHVWPQVTVVLEGAARAAADPVDDPQGRVSVVTAPGSGDDTIVEVVRAARLSPATGPVVVVTADRELRSRCESLGAAVTGPRWLLDLTDPRS